VSTVPGVLVVCGKEIINNARTTDYLRHGLGSPDSTIEIGDGCDCSVLYRLFGGEPVTFTDPASDPAPWHDDSNAESDAFLGFLLNPPDFTGVMDSPIERAVYQRSGGIQGAVAGAQKLVGRMMTITVTLVASECCGLDYGFRWLTNTLAATLCDNCGVCPAEVRVCCPPDDGSDDADGLWLIYDVALIDGPHVVYNSGIEPECCDMRQVQFTLMAENPYLYQAPTTCLSPSVIPGIDLPC
jgi:hypothetical protein